MSSSGPAAIGSDDDALVRLRPLSIGEVLDRAFTICFKHLIPFIALVAVVLIPYMTFDYLGTRGYFDAIQSGLGSLQGAAAGGVPPDPTRAVNALFAGSPYFAAMVLILVVFVPLANAAVVSGVSRAYLGLPVRWVACYADALPRWLSLLALMCLWFVIMIGAAFAFSMMFVLLSLALGVISMALGRFGDVVSAIIAIAVGVGSILLAMTLYLTATYSFVGIVLERIGALSGLASGFRRVFAKGQLGRSIGIAASLFGILCGLYLVGLVLGYLSFALTKSFALDFTVSSIVLGFTYPFAFAVVAVSYYDVRIRREGFDLQLLAARLAAPPAAPT
jgi:hypothetical protein